MQASQLSCEGKAYYGVKSAVCDRNSRRAAKRFVGVGARVPILSSDARICTRPWQRGGEFVSPNVRLGTLVPWPTPKPARSRA